KTLQPLKKNSIPLEVRSFLEPSDLGTWISDSPEIEPETPFYILKKNQTLLSISLNDLDFIVENNLSQIFSTFSSYNVKVNLLQNTAISCSFAIDVDDLLFDSLIADLSVCFKVKYNTGLELLTIRHYKDDQIQNLIKDKTILLSQKNRTTIQVLLKS
ncbi:aspartate kinase, partial [Flavobacteriales bacterium]|nr:aspartate kinase [Flavobacteriales bacterium]